MAKEHFCIIKLDPFYQAFLRARFEQTNQNGVFVFDKGHDLSLLLQFLVKPKPVDYKPTDYGVSSFRIAIPAMEHKNPATYNYLSEERQLILVKRIMRYWKMISHDVIAEARRRGVDKKEIVYMMLDELDLPEYYSDRIEREYSRYLHEERNRKYLRQKKVMLKNVKKLSVKRCKTSLA
jgi:hypothetical protein